MQHQQAQQAPADLEQPLHAAAARPRDRLGVACTGVRMLQGLKLPMLSGYGQLAL